MVLDTDDGPDGKQFSAEHLAKDTSVAVLKIYVSSSYASFMRLFPPATVE